MMPRFSRLAILLLPLACSPKDESQTPSANGQGPALAQNLTFYADVKPILEQNCVNCHRVGGIAPFSLEETNTALRLHKAIAQATQTGAMPPWLAGPDCQDYANDRSLSEEAIQTLGAWSAAGAPVGDAADYVAPIPKPEELSRVDRELMPPESYVPKPRTNDYRCFIIDWPDTSTQYITGAGVQPGQPGIVHHVIAYRVPPQLLDAVKAMDEAEAGPGYTCFGGPLEGGKNLPQIAHWAPGSMGRDLPAGTGLKIEPGSKIVMQVHYHTEHGTNPADRSKLLLKLDTSVEKEAFVVPFTNSDWVNHHTMLIPAGQNNVIHSYAAPFTQYAAAFTGGQISASAPLKIYSSALHMHLLGQSTRLQVERKGGTQSCLLDIPRWDFHWQSSYVLKETMTVNPGDRLNLECRFNNPGPKDVNWGEGTEDEMCIGFVYVSP